MNLDASKFTWQELNNKIRTSDENITISNCYGERFIGDGCSDKTITISGVPGNALGAYLDGGEIIAKENVQDAVGDTMNSGKIIVYGSAGDALGYAMRGGKIFVKGDTGYRTGIHMKEYMDKCPVIIVGGKTGSFLGEYLAGGKIIVLGLDSDTVPTGNFIGTGMHGGEIWIRSKTKPQNLPKQVSVKKATIKELEKINIYIDEFSEYYNISKDKILNCDFYKLTPDTKNPYKRLYTQN